MLQYIFAVRRVSGVRPRVSTTFLAGRRLFCDSVCTSNSHFHRFTTDSRSRERKEKRTTRAIARVPDPSDALFSPEAPMQMQMPSGSARRIRVQSITGDKKRKMQVGREGKGDPIPWLGAPRGASSVIRQVMRPSPSPGDRKRAWLERP